MIPPAPQQIRFPAIRFLLGLEPEVVRVFGRDETKQFYQRHRHREQVVEARGAAAEAHVGDVEALLVRRLEGVDDVLGAGVADRAREHVEVAEQRLRGRPELVGKPLDLELAAVLRRLDGVGLQIRVRADDVVVEANRPHEARL